MKMKKLSKLSFLIRVLILLLGCLIIGLLGAVWRWLTGDLSYCLSLIGGMIWGSAWVNIFLD